MVGVGTEVLSSHALFFPFVFSWSWHNVLGYYTHLCSWVQDFLTSRPQIVRMGKHVSSSITLNTGAPQGCVLSPLLFSLYTYDCRPSYETNTIIKFADDTIVVGKITNNNESAYRAEVENLERWSQDNNLVLNATKTKEMILDFRRLKPSLHCPININGEKVEIVQSFKYLGVHISHNATWTANTSLMVKKGLQRLHFLRLLKKARLPQQLLVNFYRSVIESVITYCIAVWYSGCTSENKKSLQRIIKTAEKITGSQLPGLEDIYRARCIRKAKTIIRDPAHPGHNTFTLLPSGKRYRTLYAHTTRLKNSFYHRAVALLNTTSSIGT